jgi:exopolysaccharide biosynthesis polyprenyl glycosylphosphotransferase
MTTSRKPARRRPWRVRVPLSAEWLFTLTLVFFDAVLLDAVFQGVFRFWLGSQVQQPVYLESYIQVRGWLFLLFLAFGTVFDLFRIRAMRAVSDIFSHSAATLLSTFVGFNLLVFFWRPLAVLTHTFPRPIVLISVAFSIVALFFLRVFLGYFFRSHPLLRRVIIIGDEQEGRRILRHFHRRGGVRYRLLSCMRADQIDELAATVFFHHVHEVLVTDPSITLESFWAAVYYQRKEEPHEFLVRISYDPRMATGTVGLASIEDLPLHTVSSLPLTPVQRWLKRGFDIAFSLFALLIVSPLMVTAAILGQIGSPGPVFYKQRRIGRYGKEFDVVKFRSMHVGAESGSGPKIAVADDPRTSPWGGFLRRFGLDELPQFFLVLIGEMSVVGPRPERPFFVQRHHEFQGRRLAVRPGVTGLAAVNARYYLRLVDKVGYDYYYLDHYSLILDIKIVFQTVWVLFMESDKALEDRHHERDHMGSDPTTTAPPATGPATPVAPSSHPPQEASSHDHR